MGLIRKLVFQFVKGRWGSILPAIFKMAAEGGFGPAVQKVYWFGAKYKTVTGALLWAVGAGLETVCGNYPEFSWACKFAAYPYYLGMFLTGVGLADGGTRSPWPAGTNKEDWVVK